jgi:[ribosomal protein S5]-alanine N-acetyltransferase
VTAIETFWCERLRAERLRPGHLDLLCRMHADGRVMATLGGVRSEAETRQFLERNLQHWERYGYGLWLFRDRSDHRFVGRGGLRHVQIGGRDQVELAYALDADCWGKGLATEIAAAVLAAGFGPLSLAEVVCFALTTNRASRRVMEKSGFRFEGELLHAGWPHVLYRLSASDWRQFRRA